MESKAKFLGHAIHPMLVVFPLGLLITSVIFDILYFATDNASFATTAYWCIAAGVIGGLLAAVFGTLDWLNIPAGTRAKALGQWHGIGNGASGARRSRLASARPRRCSCRSMGYSWPASPGRPGWPAGRSGGRCGAGADPPAARSGPPRSVVQ